MVANLFDPAEFDANAIDALYIGIAPPGGKLPEEWRPIIQEAIKRKIDIVSGLHDFLVDDTSYLSLAKESGGRLIDVRRNNYRETAKRHLFRKENVRIHAEIGRASCRERVSSKV